ncbi:M15 family metallopeptidase [Candidatus Falkowbacteria bacterium]|nr:M15 family metallopeptidase [Candidatus Falkowbacteria bacterium]
MNRLDSLKPKVRRLALALMAECRRQGLSVVITQTLRTVEEQNRLYACGRTTPGKVVTQVRGGFSFHNYGVAFDFCPVKAGKADWNDLKSFDRIGAIGKSVGLEWGGSWKWFKDRPHFQYTDGYAIEDFLQGNIDWQRFA